MNSKIIDSFISGVELFNQGQTLAGHDKWEKLWKVGDEGLRDWIKGWIQYSGSVLNIFAGKKRGAIYLARKSIENLTNDEISLSVVDVKSALLHMKQLIVILEDDDTSQMERVETAKKIRIRLKKSGNSNKKKEG